jgi:hypothetical protein
MPTKIISFLQMRKLKVPTESPEHFHFSPVKLILIFWCLELKDNAFSLFKSTKLSQQPEKMMTQLHFKSDYFHNFYKFQSHDHFSGTAYLFTQITTCNSSNDYKAGIIILHLFYERSKKEV